MIRREVRWSPAYGLWNKRRNQEVLPVRGAIFDMDGLLLDTERLYRESWVETAKEFGQTPVPEFPAAVSGSNGEVMRQIVHRYYPAVDAHS